MAGKLEQRRRRILELLSQVPISSTMQLAAETGVSAETMRKDLDALGAEGLILKVHGGVAIAGVHGSELPFDTRVSRNAAEKQRIGKAAVALIEAGDSIVLESCTTNLELAKALVLNEALLDTLVIVTNSFSIATVFDGGKKCRKLFFLGGWVNPGEHATSGFHTTRLLEDFHVNKSFISGLALSDEYVLTGFFDDDVAFQKTAIRSAKETVLMIDGSKFGQAAILSVARLSELDYLVTEKILTPQEQAAISAQGVSILQA